MGPLIVLLVGVYFYFHVDNLHARISAGDRITLGYPWIVLFDGLVPRAVSIVSLVGLPVVALAILLIRTWEAASWLVSLCGILCACAACLISMYIWFRIREW